MSEADRNALVKDVKKANYEREQEDAQMVIDEKQDVLFRPSRTGYTRCRSLCKELNLVLVLNTPKTYMP
jgi:hypothetical protein